MVIQEKKKKLSFNGEEKAKKFWIRSIFKERKLKGEFHTLVQDFKLFDSEYFLKQFRIPPTKLEEILSWIAPKIEKSSIRR